MRIEYSSFENHGEYRLGFTHFWVLKESLQMDGDVKLACLLLDSSTDCYILLI